MATANETLAMARTASNELFKLLTEVFREITTLAEREQQITKELEAKKDEFGALLAKIEDAKAEHATVTKDTSAAYEAKAVAEKVLENAKALIAKLKAQL